MSHYKIAVIPGDGTGPEVVAQGVKVLKSAVKNSSVSLAFTEFNWGAQRYLSTGEVLSDEEMNALRSFDAIYLGAIGDPQVKSGILERGILLKLRFGLDQYINYRPVRLYPNVYTPIKGVTDKDIDYLVIRENTGDLYTGIGSYQNKGTEDELAIQEMRYSLKQVRRCVRFAFEAAQKRHQSRIFRGLSEADLAAGYRGKVTLCGKTNVLTYVFELWERVFYEIAKEYPQIKTDYTHVDAVCIYMIEDPGRFDVIVTSNMFGDIITDLAAVTQGGMGVAAGANINPEGVSMFEPIGGTAPLFTGKNEINPMAAIGAAHLMMDHLGEPEIAQKIETAKQKVLLKMKSMAAAKMGYSTTQIGDMVVESL